MVYHTGWGLRGGFVGVDIFFVISGYLITQIIAEDLLAGRFSLKRFWERRLRRILPAALVMMTVVLAAGHFLLLPDDYRELAQATLSQLLCAGNIYYWFQTGYFAGPADVKPLLHTWSLAVEEQFYLLFPWLLMLLLGHFRRYAIPVMAMLAAISFITCVLITPRYPNAAFYLLPTRAWELLVGSLIALMPAPRTRLGSSGLLPQLSAFIAMAGLCSSILLLKADTSFPGVKAAVPVFSTALLIHLHRSYETWPRRLLASRWLVAVGLISYSLYLWHWPLMALMRYLLGWTPPFFMILPLVLSFVIAFLSWKFVEQPVRRQTNWLGSVLYRRVVAAAMLPCVASVCIWSGQGWPSRLAPTTPLPELPQTLADRYFTSEVEFELDELPHLGAPRVEPSFLLWGDSHAQALAPLIDEVARSAGAAGRLASRGGTPPLLDAWRKDATDLEKHEALRFNANVLNKIRARPWRAIIVVVAWQTYTGDVGLMDAEGQANNLQVLKRQLAKISNSIPARTPVFWIRPPPRQKSDLAAAVRKKALHTWMAVPGNGLNRQQYETQTAECAQVFLELQTAQHRWIDPSPEFFDAQGQPCLLNGPDFCYVDDNHVSMAGARLYYGRAISEIFNSLYTRAQSSVEPNIDLHYKP